MKYTTEEGKIIFVEVKSTSGKDIVFYTSENELGVAEKNPDSYEIYLVKEIETNPHINKLGNLFNYQEGEDREDNSKFKLITEKIYKNFVKLNNIIVVEELFIRNH